MVIGLFIYFGVYSNFGQILESKSNIQESSIQKSGK